MARGRFVSYLRVSTAKQVKSGLGLEAQREAVRTYLNGGKWELVAEFVETESGKVADRPQLLAALERCRLTGATLVVAKLDRLSRNLAFLATLVEAGVPFVACDNPNASKFTVHILAAVAEHEREAISARTKAALAAAKARGVVMGGFRGVKVDHAAGRAARAAQADGYATRLAPVVTELQASGMSLRQIAAEMTARSIQTPRGGEWTATAVSRLLDRVAA